jgi:allophanate hydrolase
MKGAKGLEDLSIEALSAAYRERRMRPSQLIDALWPRIDAPDTGCVWISRVPRQSLMQRARELDSTDPASLPLYGVPFAIKDNIDLAGLATTAACPASSYEPARSAHVVERLLAAGAIAVGKTNLDQFATGLVGTRSPFGACHNAFAPGYISGGSSSGSAVAVARGLVSFSLGTDTAGSGRVPAAFNNVVGLKPTLGRLSTRGVVPACRTLDAVSIFALTAGDAAQVGRAAQGFDPEDPYSRRPPQGLPAAVAPGGGFRFGVPGPAELEFFGNSGYAQLFDQAIARLEALGGTRVPIGLSVFLEAGRLLYEGPWVAERYVVVETLLASRPDAMLPVTRGIIEGARRFSAADAFRAQYRLQALRAAAAGIWQDIDILLTPTAGTIYRIADIEADPVRLNANLGYYTTFVNLLDLAAVAVPSGFDARGLPFGITLTAPAWNDDRLLELAARYLREAQAIESTRSAEGVTLAVCGAHMQGLPLNGQLAGIGARFLERTVTAPRYRFYALPGGPPQRPGLVRVEQGGASIEVELWCVPAASFGQFVAGIPRPLSIGKVELGGGGSVCGFLCETYAVAGARDITALGGWRAWLARSDGL